MRQDSETNIIVLNTALRYKIQRNTQKKTQYIECTKYKHILKNTNIIYIHICTRARVEEAICVYSAGHVTRFQPMRLQYF